MARTYLIALAVITPLMILLIGRFPDRNARNGSEPDAHYLHARPDGLDAESPSTPSPCWSGASPSASRWTTRSISCTTSAATSRRDGRGPARAVQETLADHGTGPALHVARAVGGLLHLHVRVTMNNLFYFGFPHGLDYHPGVPGRRDPRPGVDDAGRAPGTNHGISFRSVRVEGFRKMEATT